MIHLTLHTLHWFVKMGGKMMLEMLTVPSVVSTENQYKEKLQRRCCKDGLREIPMPYSCTRRSLYITEGWECMRAFRYCCAIYRNQEFETAIPTTPPPFTTPSPTTTFAPVTIAPSIRIYPDTGFGFVDVVPYSRDFSRNYCSCLLSRWQDVKGLMYRPLMFTFK